MTSRGPGLTLAIALALAPGCSGSPGVAVRQPLPAPAPGDRTAGLCAARLSAGEPLPPPPASKAEAARRERRIDDSLRAVHQLADEPERVRLVGRIHRRQRLSATRLAGEAARLRAPELRRSLLAEALCMGDPTADEALLVLEVASSPPAGELRQEVLGELVRRDLIGLERGVTASLALEPEESRSAALRGFAGRPTLGEDEARLLLWASSRLEDPAARREIFRTLFDRRLLDVRQVLEFAADLPPDERYGLLAELIDRGLDAAEAARVMLAAESLDDPAARRDILLGLVGTVDNDALLRAARGLPDAPQAEVVERIVEQTIAVPPPPPTPPRPPAWRRFW